MKILIPLDGSKFAEDVLGPVSQLASLSEDNIEVHLIRVVDASDAHTTWLERPPTASAGGVTWGVDDQVIYPDVPGAAVAAETKDQAEDRIYGEAKDYLEHVAHRFFSDSSTDNVIHVILGVDPAEQILDYGRSNEVDLIAIATHGRTGLARVLLGSVAQKLLKAHVAPVFMVRPKALDESGSHGESSSGSGVSRTAR